MKRIGSKLGLRIVIPINPGKFEIGMRSRSDPQNIVMFRIAAIHDPIRQKPANRLVESNTNYYAILCAFKLTSVSTGRSRNSVKVIPPLKFLSGPSDFTYFGHV
jgi:hypothetical protein